jgi:hypothetical protein
MTLEEAIKEQELALNGLRERFPDTVISDSCLTVLAAAKAMACKRCNGTGRNTVFFDDPKKCPDCRELRQQCGK